MKIHVADLLAIFLFGFGVLICLSVGIQLLFRKKGIRQTNVLLGLLLVLNALTLSNSLLSMTGITSQYQFLYFLPLSFSLSMGPLFYFFIRSKLQSSFRLQWKHAIHFIIPLMQFGFYLAIGFRSTEYKSMIWRQVVGPYVQYIEEGLLIVQSIVYLGLSWRMIHQKMPTGTWEQPLLRWLRNFTLSLALLFLISSFYEILDWILWGWYEYNLFNTAWLDFPLKLAYAGISFSIGYNAYLYQNQVLIVKKITEPKGDTALQAQMKELMEQEKVYLDPELNLDTFSKMLGQPKHLVSQQLSKNGETFRAFINHYRVEEFIRRVEKGGQEHLSLLGIALDSGFNSKASFNRIFKNQKGSSPSLYFQSQGVSL